MIDKKLANFKQLRLCLLLSLKFSKIKLSCAPAQLALIYAQFLVKYKIAYFIQTFHTFLKTNCNLQIINNFVTVCLMALISNTFIIIHIPTNTYQVDRLLIVVVVPVPLPVIAFSFLVHHPPS